MRPPAVTAASDTIPRALSSAAESSLSTSASSRPRTWAISRAQLSGVAQLEELLGAAGDGLSEPTQDHRAGARRAPRREPGEALAPDAGGAIEAFPGVGGDLPGEAVEVGPDPRGSGQLLGPLGRGDRSKLGEGAVGGGHVTDTGCEVLAQGRLVVLEGAAVEHVHHGLVDAGDAGDRLSRQLQHRSRTLFGGLCHRPCHVLTTQPQTQQAPLAIQSPEKLLSRPLPGGRHAPLQGGA